MATIGSKERASIVPRIPATSSPLKPSELSVPSEPGPIPTTIASQSERRYFFEHEATVRAAVVGRAAAPSVARDTGALVQFVVDSSGRVDTSTVRLLAARGSRMGRTELATLIGGWPFTPGKVLGCPVAQMVQMSVR